MLLKALIRGFKRKWSLLSLALKPTSPCVGRSVPETAGPPDTTGLVCGVENGLLGPLALSGLWHQAQNKTSFLRALEAIFGYWGYKVTLAGSPGMGSGGCVDGDVVVSVPGLLQLQPSTAFHP